MRVVKIKYWDGTIYYEKTNALYLNCIQNISAIDDVPLAFYGMTENEITAELKRIGISEENILKHISKLPKRRKDLGENNLFKDKLYK